MTIGHASHPLGLRVILYRLIDDHRSASPLILLEELTGAVSGTIVGGDDEVHAVA